MFPLKHIDSNIKEHEQIFIGRRSCINYDEQIPYFNFNFLQ